MSRTDTEKREQQSGLARIVAQWRREGENELETATRVLAEIAGLKKLDGRKPQRKGEPQTNVAGFFEPADHIPDLEKSDVADLIRKGDPRKVLRMTLSADVETNGTVTIATIYYGRSSNNYGVGVSKRSPHDDRNDETGRNQAVVRGIRDLVHRVESGRRAKAKRKTA